MPISLCTSGKPCNRGGRPTRLTPELHAAIVAAAGRGVTLTSIADALGVGVGTLGEWLRRGQGTSRRPAVEPYLSFAEDFAAARGRWERNRIAYLRRVPPRARVRWRRRGEPSS